MSFILSIAIYLFNLASYFYFSRSFKTDDDGYNLRAATGERTKVGTIICFLSLALSYYYWKNFD